jgi:hypothetical protein
VKLEPEGLRLWKPATLLIEPAQTVPAGEEFPFMSREGGKDFHLYPLELGTRKVSFKLYHFTEVGLARGTSEDVQTQLARVPLMTEAQFEQRIAELFLREREAQLGGRPAEPNFRENVKALCRAYFEQHIAPNLGRARVDCEFAKDSGLFHKALSWSRMGSLMGFIEEDQWFADREAEVMDSMRQASETCFNDAYRGCNENSNPEHVLDMIKAARTVALLTGSETPGMSMKIQQCLSMRFVIEFTSQTQYHSKQPISLFASTRSGVRGVAPLTFTKEGIGGPHFEGEASLTYLSLFAEPGGLLCSATGLPAQSTGHFTATVWPNLNDYPKGAGTVVVQIWPSGMEGWEMVPIDDDGGCGEKFRWDQNESGTFDHTFFGAKGHYPFRMPVNGVHRYSGRGEYPGNTSLAETTVTLRRLSD